VNLAWAGFWHPESEMGNEQGDTMESRKGRRKIQHDARRDSGWGTVKTLWIYMIKETGRKLPIDGKQVRLACEVRGAI